MTTRDLATLTTEALRQTSLAQDALVRLADALQAEVKAPVKEGVKAPMKRRLEAPFSGPVTQADWRASHRSGKPPRIDSDPELRAFVQSRIDRLTFDAIAREITATFPPDRRVSRSTLHRWWQRNRTSRPSATG